MIKRIVGRVVFFVLVVAIISLAYFNRGVIYDFYRAKTYRPSEEMVSIRDSLDLTDKGKFLFDASRPEFNEKDDFNTNCQKENEEIAVLGCYTLQDIYIFNVQDDELKGIKELTTAHELLHAVYERMGEGEKESLKAVLMKVYEENMDILDDELKTYPEAEKLEEIFVRAGTEINELPEELEKYYGEIFRDRKKIVKFYESYISVFKEVEKELDDLALEMNNLSNSIKEKTEEYEKRIGQLNADILSFNSCAETEGCFNSTAIFNERRGGLISEQNALEGFYDEINGLIEEYNEKVEKYNEDVRWQDKLNEMINSSSKPKEVE
ncbi:hypothetical protein IJH72_02870 [Candidatus Saccharibacteria bacterium]|nr:hypothetical protein [Candidatus Saccharibacteria bacterium]